MLLAGELTASPDQKNEHSSILQPDERYERQFQGKLYFFQPGLLIRAISVDGCITSRPNRKPRVEVYEKSVTNGWVVFYEIGHATVECASARLASRRMSRILNWLLWRYRQ